MSKEPAVISGLILAVLTTGIALVAGFGVHVTQAQASLITGFVSAVLALATGLFVRSKVTPAGPTDPV